MKKFISSLILISCLFLFHFTIYGASTQTAQQVALNGQVLEIPYPLIIEKNEVLIPLEWFATKMGASSITWDPASKTVSVIVDDFLKMHQYLSYLDGLEKYKDDEYPLPKKLQNLDLPPYPLMSKNPPIIHADPIRLNIISHGTTMPWAVYDYVFKDNRIYVGTDWLNILFLAQITQTPNGLSITYPTPEVLNQSIASLEKISLPTSAEDALALWIRGQEHRSGGLQYIALSPDLKEAVLTSIYAGDSWWVTGGSRPSFRNPKVTQLSSPNKDTKIFQIDFDEVDGVEVSKHAKQVVTIKKYIINHNTYWLIDEVTGDKDYFTNLPTVE